MALYPDFKDLLSAFATEKVRYLLVGGYAVSFHSRPRFTKDIDLWIATDVENIGRACAALALFGAPQSPRGRPARPDRRAGLRRRARHLV